MAEHSRPILYNYLIIASNVSKPFSETCLEKLQPSAADHRRDEQLQGRVFDDVADAPFFFGREALVQWLLNEVRPATEGQAVNRFLAADTTPT